MTLDIALPSCRRESESPAPALKLRLEQDETTIAVSVGEEVVYIHVADLCAVAYLFKAAADTARSLR